jgi:hypothetical protein
MIVAACYAGMGQHGLFSAPFRRMIAMVGGETQMPSPSLFAVLTSEVYDAIVRMMYGHIQSSGDAVNITADHWRHGGRNMLGVTAHYMDESWRMQCVCARV